MESIFDVDIIMVSYNQEIWIKEAIESVLNQKTNFRFRLIIGDDCSTDNTTSIIERYARDFPDIVILLKSDKNEGIVRNYLKCFEFCTAELICILEGDDYWIDIFKLENQFSLFKDPTIGLAHSNYTMYVEKNKKFKKTTRTLSAYNEKNQGFI